MRPPAAPLKAQIPTRSTPSARAVVWATCRMAAARASPAAETKAGQLEPRALISSAAVVRTSQHDRGSECISPEGKCACHASRSMEKSTQIGKRRVLVADDNAMLRRALQIVLQLWGFEVTVVEDGSAALTAARTGDHGAVVMDIRMPEMDGLEVARRIRADPSSSALLLLALSGSGEPEDRSAALAAGFDHHLVKPVDPELLRQLLESAPAPR